MKHPGKTASIYLRGDVLEAVDAYTDAARHRAGVPVSRSAVVGELLRRALASEPADSAQAAQEPRQAAQNAGGR
jgi:hypothetical protein